MASFERERILVEHLLGRLCLGSTSLSDPNAGGSETGMDHVHSGGQAVVGMVETPGGGCQPKSKEQPHAIPFAPGIEMPSPNPERSTVPSASDAERPLPDARRNVAGLHSIRPPFSQDTVAR